jgi:hypothetical protein
VGHVRHELARDSVVLGVQNLVHPGAQRLDDVEGAAPVIESSSLAAHRVGAVSKRSGRIESSRVIGGVGKFP